MQKGENSATVFTNFQIVSIAKAGIGFTGSL